jgi:hypothetical protein
MMLANSTVPLEALSRAFPARPGDLIVTHVDPQIFQRRYFTQCLDCNFCHDSCCQFGCDVDLHNIERLHGEHVAGLEAFLDLPRAEWLHEEILYDAELQSGAFRRTRTANGRCILKNPHGRGCGIHAYCHAQGIDYHDLKPTICWLFPICVDGAALRAASEIVDNSLVCIDQGPTLYRAQRDELLYLYGPELVRELDALEQRFSTAVGDVSNSPESISLQSIEQ